jgi:hypothetical protein
MRTKGVSRRPFSGQVVGGFSTFQKRNSKVFVSFAATLFVFDDEMRLAVGMVSIVMVSSLLYCGPCQRASLKSGRGPLVTWFA